MRHRLAALILSAAMVGGQVGPGFAQSSNPMNYTLVGPGDAQSLPNRGGALGMNIQRGQQVSSSGMSFQLMQVTGVRPGTPGAQAGFHPGDQIVAVDGHVFADTAAFAAYVRSMPPGKLLSVDIIPSGGGPQQAQRLGVTVGNGGRAVAPAAAQQSGGLSTGEKLAIGAGAVALFGCYEMGCFNRNKAPVSAPTQQPQ